MTQYDDNDDDRYDDDSADTRYQDPHHVRRYALTTLRTCNVRQSCVSDFVPRFCPPPPRWLGPLYGAIAVPSVTRCRCCGHRWAGGVRQCRRATVATPGEWQCKTGGVRRLAVANGPNIFQMLLLVTLNVRRIRSRINFALPSFHFLISAVFRWLRLSTNPEVHSVYCLDVRKGHSQDKSNKFWFLGYASGQIHIQTNR